MTTRTHIVYQNRSPQWTRNISSSFLLHIERVMFCQWHEQAADYKVLELLTSATERVLILADTCTSYELTSAAERRMEILCSISFMKSNKSVYQVSQYLSHDSTKLQKHYNIHGKDVATIESSRSIRKGQNRREEFSHTKEKRARNFRE